MFQHFIHRLDVWVYQLKDSIWAWEVSELVSLPALLLLCPQVSSPATHPCYQVQLYPVAQVRFTVHSPKYCIWRGAWPVLPFSCPWEQFPCLKLGFHWDQQLLNNGMKTYIYLQKLGPFSISSYILYLPHDLLPVCLLCQNLLLPPCQVGESHAWPFPRIPISIQKFYILFLPLLYAIRFVLKTNQKMRVGMFIKYDSVIWITILKSSLHSTLCWHRKQHLNNLYTVHNIMTITMEFQSPPSVMYFCQQGCTS